MSKPPEGAIPGPIVGREQLQCYEGMEISTCVIAKLNNDFVWKDSGPPVSFIFVLLGFCYNLKIVVRVE